MTDETEHMTLCETCARLTPSADVLVYPSARLVGACCAEGEAAELTERAARGDMTPRDLDRTIEILRILWLRARRNAPGGA